MRITTNMIMRNYSSSLNSSLYGLDQARQQVETGKRFTQSYVDPVAASKAVLLENRLSRNSEYLNSTEEMLKWQDTQEDVLTDVNDILKEVTMKYSLEALNDTNGAERGVYANTMRELQKSMVNTLNVKYGDSHVLAGNDGENPPFELLDDGTVTFRGIDVNTTDATELATLQQYAEEGSFVDLGFGLAFDATGEIIPSSAFNAAVPGIVAIGYGQDANGNPKNVLALMGEMADMLEQDPFDHDAYSEVAVALEDATDLVLDNITMLGTRTALLESTQSRLESEELNIIEQYSSTVNIDPAEAITNFTYAQYVYNASLKVGMSILSPSLLDFMQ